MPSTTELMETELGKAFVEAREKDERIKMGYRENVIGERVVVQYNPHTLLNINPYAEAISKEFDKMIDRVIPKDAVLSAQFESWINREKNELLVDSKIARDNYFKEQTDFSTGEITINRRNDLLQAKIDYLNKELGRLEKAFTTFMKNKPEQAYADEVALKKYEEYYLKQSQTISERLEKGDFSSYDKKDKSGEITKFGSEEDALKHKSNVDTLLAKVQDAQIAQDNKENTEADTQDFVGESINKFRTQKVKI